MHSACVLLACCSLLLPPAVAAVAAAVAADVAVAAVAAVVAASCCCCCFLLLLLLLLPAAASCCCLLLLLLPPVAASCCCFLLLLPAAASCCCCFRLLLLLPPPPPAAATSCCCCRWCKHFAEKENYNLDRLVWRWREIRAGDASRERERLQKAELMKHSSSSCCCCYLLLLLPLVQTFCRKRKLQSRSPCLALAGDTGGRRQQREGTFTGERLQKAELMKHSSGSGCWQRYTTGFSDFNIIDIMILPITITWKSIFVRKQN